MMHINMRKFSSAFLFGLIATMLYAYGSHWTKRHPVLNLINDTHFGEMLEDIDCDLFDNIIVLSKIRKTGEISLSVTGKKFWQSTKAKPSEPKDIVSISSKSIKTWTLGLTEDRTRFIIKNMDGTLWGTTKSKELCKFVKGADDTYEWQKDTSVKNVKRVFSGIDGDTWLLAEKAGSGNQVYHLNNGTWEAKPGKGMFFLAVSDKDHVWAIDKASKIYKWDGSKNNWTYVTIALTAKSIYAGPPEDVSGTISDNLWFVSALGTTFKRKLPEKKWEPMGGLNVQKITVGRSMTTSITSALVLQAARKFEFQFLPSDVIWEVYARPSEIIKAKKGKVTPKKTKAEKAAPAIQTPVATVPVTTTPEKAAPAIQTPVATVPVTTTPETTAPAIQAPEITTQEPAAPAIQAPEKLVVEKPLQTAPALEK
jgi:hypothetical protein